MEFLHFSLIAWFRICYLSFSVYPTKARAFFFCIIHDSGHLIGKVKEGYRLFRTTQEGKAFLLIDLVMFIYVHYPSFDQTRKVISIIAYMDRELHFKTSESVKKKLSSILYRYSFIYNTGNLPDLCEWLPFCLEYGISYDMKTESTIVNITRRLNNPILWGLVLMYSQYNKNLNQHITEELERIIEKQMDMIKPSHAKEQVEFWYILVFHNCPFLSQKVLQIIEDRINEIRSTLPSPRKPNSKCEEIICDYLDLKSANRKKPETSFFSWKSINNFSDLNNPA